MAVSCIARWIMNAVTHNRLHHVAMWLSLVCFCVIWRSLLTGFIETPIHVKFMACGGYHTRTRAYAHTHTNTRTPLRNMKHIASHP